MLPGQSHRGSLIPCGRYLLASLTGTKEGSKGLMVLRVRPTPTRFPTNSLYIPMDNIPLHSIPRMCQPWCLFCCLPWKSLHKKFYLTGACKWYVFTIDNLKVRWVEGRIASGLRFYDSGNSSVGLTKPAVTMTLTHSSPFHVVRCGPA